MGKVKSQTKREKKETEKEIHAGADKSQEAVIKSKMIGTGKQGESTSKVELTKLQKGN